MKFFNKLLIVSFTCFSSFITAQDFTSPIDHTQEIRYKQGEVLVKFHDDIKLEMELSRNMVQTNYPSINASFEQYQVKNMEKLFAGAKKHDNSRKIVFPDGTRKNLPQLFNIYVLEFPKEKDAKELVESLKNLKEVEYAELNGEAYINEAIPQGEAFTEDQLQARPNKTQRDHTNRVITPNDPLYPDQWYLPAVKADSLWHTTTGDTSQVISILDTGVDYLHPDLQNKIWTNWDEIPDNGIDDDNNGYIDDVRGWDFVNQDNDPKDDNSHGTHCAGIAGAETDNGIGIAGTSWGVRIMPVKVFQSNGIGYFSHIAQGFWYAAQNGSTIFSNSWSSSGESLTIRNAMEYAYAFGLIVAAAGNQQHKIDWPFPPWPPTVPNFPACYNWVLGVEATDQNGNNTWFSNYDPTGPIISDGREYGSIFYNDNDYNYEMRAPGLSFISTVPNGQYRNYSGTSMACPLVAGSIALMKSYDSTLSNEMVFAKLIQPIKLSIWQAGVLDIHTCTFTNPPPDIYFDHYTVHDSLYGGDNDGKPDAGETIEMYVNVKNAGGLSDTTYARLRFSEFEDTTTARIIDSTCYIGSISAYANMTSQDPIKVTIDSNVVNARIISFELLIWEEGNTDTTIKSITLKVEHGIEIKGTIEGILHLTGDAYYLVTEVAVIDTLIIDPGVTLRFSAGNFIMIVNHLSAIGNADSMITFKGADDSFVKSIIMADNAYSEFEYCLFTEGWGSCGDRYLVNPTIIKHCIFTLNEHNPFFKIKPGGVYKYNVIHENNYPLCHYMIEMLDIADFEYNILSNNITNGISPFAFFGHHLDYPECMNHVINNVFMNNDMDCSVSGHNGWPMGVYKMKENYWGATNLEEIKSNILDFYEDNSRPVLEPDTILQTPPSECHGVVWKVELNDQNPQEVQLDPIGAGPLKFDVYFNRAMDTAFTPFVTFGVRYPYTQNIVLDSASWSSDSTLWTGYHTVDLSTGDGENTVRVAHAKDTDHFEIPVERSRFQFVIQAAGSQSVAFIATPGIGKVELEWPLSDSTDVLGYNLYRYKMPTDSTYSDTTLLNTGPVVDSVYTDYEVLPDSTYYYMFTVVKTDFSESDYSKVMAATPFDAATGDANGDLSVDVLDITTIVSYMLNQNPQPFLFDAADVNYDGEINVLDIIGCVQLISGKKSAPLSAFVDISEDVAYYDLKTNKITLESEGNLAGLQFEVQNPLPTTNHQLPTLKIFSLQNGFEFACAPLGDKVIGVLYSLTGKTLPAGEISLFRFEGCENNQLEITDIFGGDPDGDYVPVLKKGEQIPQEPGSAYDLNIQPNPFRESTTISWTLAERSKVIVEIYDLEGRKVSSLFEKIQDKGSYQMDLQAGNLQAGIYICHMEAISINGLHKIKKDKKIVLMK